MSNQETPFRTLCVIPARGGSKAVPHKNIVPVLGRPLLHYATTASLGATRVTRTVISTDSEEILELAKSYGPEVPLLRPAELATDSAPSHPVALHALREVEGQGDDAYDAVLLLQSVAPMVTPSDIDGVLGIMAETDADSCVTLATVGDLHPGKLKVLNDGVVKPYIETEVQWTRQLLPDVFIRNSSCYATRRSTLEAGDLYGEQIRGHVVPRERFVNIDDPIDVPIAEAMMRWVAAHSDDPWTASWIAGDSE